MTSKLLTPLQTSEILHVTPETLATWRCEDRYPLKFLKVGRKVYYDEEDVQEFIDGCKSHAL